MLTICPKCGGNKMKPLGNDIYECEYCHELFQEIQQPAPQPIMQPTPQPAMQAESQAVQPVSQPEVSDDQEEEEEHKGSNFMKSYGWPIIIFAIFGIFIVTIRYVRDSNRIEGTWHETGKFTQVSTTDGGVELTLTANITIDCDYMDDDTYSQKINFVVTAEAGNTNMVKANFACTDVGTWSLACSKDSKGTGKYAYTRAISRKFDLLKMESTGFHIDDFYTDAPGVIPEKTFKNLVTSIYGDNSTSTFKMQNVTDYSMELVDEDGYVYKCVKKQ